MVFTGKQTLLGVLGALFLPFRCTGYAYGLVCARRPSRFVEALHETEILPMGAGVIRLRF